MSQDLHLRQRIAQTCARLMIQEGIQDYHLAKCKAAARLGVPDTKRLPSNREIEKEIILYQRLFYDDAHAQQLQQLRRVALETMRLLARFQPLLAGSVLEGTANQYSDITLHLFTQTAEEVAIFLMERGIPYQLNERRFHLPQAVSFPSYCFIAGEASVVLVIFGMDDIRWSPPNPVDGKPMRRANLQAVENLLLPANYELAKSNLDSSVPTKQWRY